MADEITITGVLSVTKGELSTSRKKTVTIDMAGDDISHVTQSFTGTGSALTIAAGVSTLGTGFLNNTSSAGSLDIGSLNGTTFTGVIRLGPGEAYPVRFTPGSTPWAVPTTGTVRLEHVVVEN